MPLLLCSQLHVKESVVGLFKVLCDRSRRNCGAGLADNCPNQAIPIREGARIDFVLLFTTALKNGRFSNLDLAKFVGFTLAGSDPEVPLKQESG
jgi:hypothetical protein